MAANESEPFPSAEGEEETEDDGPDEAGQGFRFLQSEEVEQAYDFFDEVATAYRMDDPMMTALLANIIRMRRIEESEHAMLEQIRSQRDPDSAGKFPTEMSHDVPSNTTAADPHTVERTPLEEGYARITEISLGWPDGAANAVGIQMATKNGLELFPRNSEDNYVAFNDFSETFPFDYTLRPGETLVARTVNLDGTNSHFVNIVPHIEEVRPEVAERRLESQQEIFGTGDEEDN